MLTKEDIFTITNVVKGLLEENNKHLATKEDLFLVEQRLERKIEKVNERLDLLEKRIDRLEIKFDQLEQRIDRLQDEMYYQFKNLQEDIGIAVGYHQIIEDHDVRLTKLEKLVC